MRFNLKRVLALSIDLGIIISISFLFVEISHGYFNIHSKKLDSNLRSFISLGYFLSCMYFFDFRTLGMKINLLSFKRINFKTNSDIGIYRVLFFYSILGSFLLFTVMGFMLIEQFNNSAFGYLLLMASSVNFIPRYILSRKFLLHEIFSGIMISEDS